MPMMITVKKKKKEMGYKENGTPKIMPKGRK